MRKYPKIKTVFERDPENNYKTLLIGEYARPEFEYLADCQWTFREKIHGTNIRVIWNFNRFGNEIEVRGRREKSQVPEFIEEAVRERFDVDQLLDEFGDTSVTFYGEGYGENMQDVGEYYISDGHDFILFDVRIGDYWLKEEDVTDIAQKLGITRTPIIAHDTLDRAVDIVRSGFYSRVSENILYAEGLILHPKVELKDRRGRRIMTKLKHEDFEGNSMIPNE